MSQKKATNKTPKPTAEQIQKQQEEAAEKAAAQLKKDQAWVDDSTSNMTEDEKLELFHQLSRDCSGDKYVDGRIILACPVKPKLVYCVNADDFDCQNGKTSKGCSLSPSVSQGIKTPTSCIDAVFVSAEEGGSYLSPYVPWGPIGKDKSGNPVVTAGNNSGVTIGTGVDLGAMSAKDLASLQKLGVSQDTLDKLKPLVGKHQEDACKALRQLKGDQELVFKQEDVTLIDQYAFQKRAPALATKFDERRDAYIASYQELIDREQNPEGAVIGKGKKNAPDEVKIAEWQKKIDDARGFEDLSCADQTVLFSTYYHEGNIKSAYSTAYVTALIEGDPEAARAAIQAKTGDKSQLIAARGTSELRYFDDHPPAPPSPAPAATPSQPPKQPLAVQL